MKKNMFLLSLVALLVACGTADDRTLSIVPYPDEVSVKRGTFDVAGAGIHYSATFDEASKNIILGFAQQLSLVTGRESQIDSKEADRGFVFLLDTAIPEEAYKLDVSRKTAVVRASSLRGVNYAVQTIKQMLPVEVFGNTVATDKDWTLECVEIDDEPRFGYRGMHLDVSRHFFDVEMVKRYLDIMEVHKLNKFHWHLTDDQGWRIEIKKYPELTEKGAVRKETLVGHAYDPGSYYDGTPYGEGCWYTQDQIREIVAYAASKGIDIIPEIDLPGHMVAALATYPELGCTGGPYEVRTTWGVAREVLCAGNEKTMKFLEDVLAEVSELFPYEYIHIGGDECPKTSWENCPECQAKIKDLGLKDDGEFKAEHYLQSYVMERMAGFLEGRGKKIVGWDEILEGTIGKNATIMSWRGTAGGLKAAELGNDAIMTPNSFFYLDYYQSPDKENEPLAIGHCLSVEKCYSYEPLAEGMSDEEKAHIIGVQANMWTEYIATPEHLEYMLLPRLAALSEVQWCQPENKDMDRFLDNAAVLCGIYDVMGYNYATHIFDVKGSVEVDRGRNCSVVTLEAYGKIRYTIDGSEPTFESAVYTEPLEIRESCVLKARAERDGELTRLYEKSFDFHKASLRPVQVLTAPHENYSFNCPDQLVDGLRSRSGFHSGDFVGWRKTPFEAVIEMDGTSYSTVTVSTMFDKTGFVLNPTYIVVYTSEDGKEYAEAARLDIPVAGGDEKDGCREYSVSFPETSARYLKITAGSVKGMPEWSPRKGRAVYLFIDEVIVR